MTNEALGMHAMLSASHMTVYVWREIDVKLVVNVCSNLTGPHGGRERQLLYATPSLCLTV